MKTSLMTISILFLAMSVIACGNDERDKYDAMPYSEVLTSLVMENTDIKTISKSSGISTEDLIKMKYGIIAENQELTNYLRDLKCSYDNNNASDIEDLLEEQEISIDKTVVGKPLQKSDYIAKEFQNNEKFQTQLPQIGQNYYAGKVKRFIEEKYSFIGIFKNLWQYVFSSKEEYIAKYKAEFQEKMLSSDINDFMKSRINAYAGMIVEEHKVLYNIQGDVQSVNTVFQMEKMELQMDKETQQQIIKHATLDLYDFAVNVAEDTLIAFIIWAIFAIIIEISIENAISNAIRNYESCWSKKRGFWANVAVAAISAFNSYTDLETKKAEIRSKWRNVQFWCSLAITAIVLVWGYYYVMKPSAEIEVGIEQKIQGQTSEYFKSMDVWVLTELNKITKAL
jgi:hypothetical protein